MTADAKKPVPAAGHAPARDNEREHKERPHGNKDLANHGRENECE
jgi:hypothetical protein